MMRPEDFYNLVRVTPKLTPTGKFNAVVQNSCAVRQKAERRRAGWPGEDGEKNYDINGHESIRLTFVKQHVLASFHNQPCAAFPAMISRRSIILLHDLMFLLKSTPTLQPSRVSKSMWADICFNSRSFVFEIRDFARTRQREATRKGRALLPLACFFTQRLSILSNVLPGSPASVVLVLGPFWATVARLIRRPCLEVNRTFNSTCTTLWKVSGIGRATPRGYCWRIERQILFGAFFFF